MNRIQIREAVRQILRDPDYDARAINLAINSVINTLNNIGRFRFHQGSYTIATEAGEGVYLLPDNFISEVEVVYEPGTTEEKALGKYDGIPINIDEDYMAYSLWGGEIHIFPTPTEVKDVVVYGYFDVPEIFSDVAVPQIPPNYHRSIIAYGAAAEINPTLVIKQGGRSSSIKNAYEFNLTGMLQREKYEERVIPRIQKDERWRNSTIYGNIVRMR